MSLKYKCKLCGTCCHEVPGDYVKRIPLYPNEVDHLIEIAKDRDIEFKVIEDLVFPDVKNEKILVLTYRIRLNNKTQGCPFYNEVSGCTVHDTKPLACQAYPLSLKRIDAFNFEISIDPLCNFVIQNYKKLEDLDIEKLKKVFKEEYPKAEKFYRKNKKLIFKIRKLEVTSKIEIPRQVSLDEFNQYLEKWDRQDISVK
ncbi:MAG: YkgJ family cysteine cluster protein [Promethearchaeota archaeon]|nr:MAG: YkgJ family cysteine cluster protein [Candidatus Lokiarchaeota archaeon]